MPSSIDFISFYESFSFHSKCFQGGGGMGGHGDFGILGEDHQQHRGRDGGDGAGGRGGHDEQIKYQINKTEFERCLSLF